MLLAIDAKNMVNSTEELVKEGCADVQIAAANPPPVEQNVERVRFPRGGICLLICEAFEQFAYYGTRSEYFQND